MKFRVRNRQQLYTWSDSYVIVLESDDFEFIFAPAIGILLVFLFFGLQLFHHLALTITMQQGLVFIFAEVFGDIVFIQLVVSHNEEPVEGLGQHARK